MPSLVDPAIAAGTLSRADQPSLRADRLLLRPWTEADAGDLVAAYRDAGIQRWHARSMTDEEAREWITDTHAAWSAEAGASWAITADDALVGRMSLTFHLRDGVAGTAYWTVPAARGRGIASRALDAAARWCFSVGMHRVELEHSTLNTASCRVADRAGFTAEGIRRESARHAEGWHDMHGHARISTDPDPGLHGPGPAPSP